MGVGGVRPGRRQTHPPPPTIVILKNSASGGNILIILPPTRNKVFILLWVGQIDWLGLIEKGFLIQNSFFDSKVQIYSSGRQPDH